MVLQLNTESRSCMLLEVSRKDLVAKSRIQSKQRFRKRLNYQVSNFRGVDLKSLFENDYLVFRTPIKDYVCVIAFPGVFTQLRQVVKETHGDVTKINLQMVIKALRRAFDATDDIKVDCSCADFRYRFAYWATKNGYKYGAPETRPSDVTNPDDMLGATCKHLDLLLSNKRWVTKAASVVNSFIKTYPDKAALYLYDEDEIKETNVDEEEIPADDEVEVDETGETIEDEVPVEDSEEESSEEETEEVPDDTIEDSLKFESFVPDEDTFLKPTGNDSDKVTEQRNCIVDFVKRLKGHLAKYDLEDDLVVKGYGKFPRQQNYVLLSIIKDGEEGRPFWVYYADGQYMLSKLGFVDKSNQNPQKIVKYITDHMFFDM